MYWKAQLFFILPVRTVGRNFNYVYDRIDHMDLGKLDNCLAARIFLCFCLGYKNMGFSRPSFCVFVVADTYAGVYWRSVSFAFVLDCN